MTKNNNCNDYTALGNYWINSNDVAITITNLPTPKAGTLKVESGVGITGSYILNPNGWHIYTTVSQISSVWFYKYPE